MLLQRMWINQPSTLQRHHKLHGQNVLADCEPGGEWTRIWFTSGDVVSMEIEHGALSSNWVKARPIQQRELVTS